MSTKFATLQKKLPLVYEFALCFFSRPAFCFWGRFLFFSLRCVFFFLKKIAQALIIKEITFHMPGNFSFYKIVHAFAEVKSEPENIAGIKGS